LTRLLTGLGKAAEVVEAIDNLDLQKQQGWDLSRWHYDLVPWGVRFTYHDPYSGGQADVLALMAVGTSPALVVGDAGRHSRDLTVRLFG